MLVRLKVRDLVLIEELDLELSAGFNVLTGETGAGKSLVATAVHLLLGRKAGSGIVRRGAEAAEVEGLFDVADEPGVRARLEEAGLPADDELLVRRVIPADGRQRCFVNGRLSSLAMLADLAEGLASFAGQHEHLHLLEPARQLALVDEFGGLADRVEVMGTLCLAAREREAALEALVAAEGDRADRLGWLSFQLEEIERLAPEPEELATLDAEIGRLRHLELLTGTARRAAEDLYESDDSVYGRLARHAKELAKAAEHDARLGEHARALEEAASTAEAAARELAAYGEDAEDAPARLDELEARREALTALERKHGKPLSEILAGRDGLRAEVEELSRLDEAIDDARRVLEAARKAAGAHADALSDARRSAAAALSAAVGSEIADLSFANAGFEIRIETGDGEPGPTGRDRTEILVALNPGEGAHPLRQVASGGELSRLMLALRRAVAGTGPVGTYVFDEVDAGIGGAVASAVGRKLRDVAEHHQVITVTHLPQIAGLAETHYVVRKSERGGRTATEVEVLDDEARVQEIARMLGGETLTEKTKAAAREILAATR